MELCFYCLFYIWTPWQIWLLNWKYSLRCGVRRKLVDDRGRKEKQRAVTQTVTSTRFEHSNPDSGVKHKGTNDWRKALALATLFCAFASETFKQMTHRHRLSGQGSAYPCVLRSRCKEMPGLGPFLRVSSMILDFFPPCVEREGNYRGVCHLGNNPQFSIIFRHLALWPSNIHILSIFACIC